MKGSIRDTLSSRNLKGERVAEECGVQSVKLYSHYIFKFILSKSVLLNSVILDMFLCLCGVPADDVLRKKDLQMLDRINFMSR